jgi:phenylalanyl-tRNA synthetase beta chain
MRISYGWLSQYVDLPPAEELAARLTAVGLEVEAVERMGRDLDGVVAARVAHLEKHPQAEKLSVVRVDAGQGEPLQIVCGARNFQVGDAVPLATVGTVLPGGARVDRVRLRGIDSFGMLCSERELALGEGGAGLLILPRDTIPGTPLARLLGLEDTVLEVNVTPNRPDALSHLGIAREVAALTGQAVRPPPALLAEAGEPAAEAVRVRIEAPAKCARYAARVIEGIRVAPSPAWLARRLESCGIRSISNVVDATNFVLLELGHPLHAFDLDRVAGREIVVRTARSGETLTTLDAKERSLDPDDLVIADRDRGSALAGVMGGGGSEISALTTRVLLESAWFAPVGIRRTSKRHGLKTEASYRFERGADPGMVIPALDRCAALIAELAGGVVRRGVVDENPRPFEPDVVRLRWARPSEILGTEVPREETRRVLVALGFEERAGDADASSWAVPSWRQDVALEEDLVEEVVRARGYDAIPETLPGLALETPALTTEAEVAARIRTALEAVGFSEAVNFSFVAPGDLEAFDPASRPVPLRNPLSAELAVMRTSLVPSLLRNVGANLRQRVEDVRLYELARVYAAAPGPGDEPALEGARAAGVLVGRRSPHGWGAPGGAVDFFDAKGAVWAVLEALGIRASLEPSSASWAHPRAAAEVVAGARRLGTVAEVHPRLAAAFELPRGVLAFELDQEALDAAAHLTPRYGGIPRFPAVLRDLAIVVEERVGAELVLGVIRSEPLVERATLFDVYRGAPIPEGKKSFALALRYRAPERTLTDAEADAAHARIVERLRSDPGIGAELRG